MGKRRTPTTLHRNNRTQPERGEIPAKIGSRLKGCRFEGLRPVAGCGDTYLLRAILNSRNPATCNLQQERSDNLQQDEVPTTCNAKQRNPKTRSAQLMFHNFHHMHAFPVEEMDKIDSSFNVTNVYDLLVA